MQAITQNIALAQRLATGRLKHITAGAGLADYLKAYIGNRRGHSRKPFTFFGGERGAITGCDGLFCSILARSRCYPDMCSRDPGSGWASLLLKMPSIILGERPRA
jgi:hypothetical protein